MVEVYAVKVPNVLGDDLFEALLGKIDPWKRDRLLRFVRKEDRCRGLFSELLIRHIIMKKTGMTNEEITFETNEYGKPHLKGRDDFHFNLSHSGIWVVAAVDSRPVGIDVERIGDVDFHLSRSFFSDDEHNDLMSHKDQVSYFFTLWTLKESFIKIMGRGLSLPLNSFTLRYITEDRIQLTSAEGKRIKGICFNQYHIHGDYKLMLCATHDNFAQDVMVQTPQYLMKGFLT